MKCKVIVITTILVLSGYWGVFYLLTPNNVEDNSKTYKLTTDDVMVIWESGYRHGVLNQVKGRPLEPSFKKDSLAARNRWNRWNR